MRTTRYRFHIHVKNQQTRLALIKFLILNKIPEHVLHSVNTLRLDPVTGKPDDSYIDYSIEFWADLPSQSDCQLDIFDMILDKFKKRIEFCYAEKINVPRTVRTPNVS